MGEWSSGPGPAQPADTGDSDATRTFPGRDPVSRQRPADPANPSHQPPTEVARPYQPTEVARPYQPTEVARPYQPTEVAPRQQQAGDAAPTRSASNVPPHEPPANAAPSDVVRYGPGVPVAPVSQAGLTAEQVWRTARLPEPPRRKARLRRLLSSALTVILLAAAGVVLYLRFHHAPLHVSGVEITQLTKSGCGVDVTGRIATNGAAGTVSYQWVFQPQVQAPQPLSQSVVAGQHDVYVTVAVEGQGHGSASQEVTLQVLGPDSGSASKQVTVSC